MTKKLKTGEKWSYWLNKCDTLFSRLVKERDGWRCVETGANFNLQTAHIISREYKNIRWDFDNAITLKSGRHAYYTYHPIEWKLYINKKFGAGYYEKMEKKAIVYKKWTTEDLKEVYAKLETISFDNAGR